MKRIVLIFLAVVAALLLANSLFVVRETDQVIITMFGKPGEGEGEGVAITQSGLHFKLPFFQRIRRFDKRFLEWDGARNELPTRDKRFIFVDTYARWQITDPLKFLERLNDEDGARRRLDDILDGETRNAIAKDDLVEVVRTSNRTPEEAGQEPEEQGVLEPIDLGREKIRLEILSKAQSRTGDLGIAILDVQFKRINYAEEDVRKAIENRMIAERQRIAARYRSQGDGEAARILGEREREVQRILSEAYETSEGIRGRADAEATRIYADAYNSSTDSRRFYALLKTFDTYRKTFDENTTLLLSTDADFFGYLKRSGG